MPSHWPYMAGTWTAQSLRAPGRRRGGLWLSRPVLTGGRSRRTCRAAGSRDQSPASFVVCDVIVRVLCFTLALAVLVGASGPVTVPAAAAAPAGYSVSGLTVLDPSGRPLFLIGASYQG